MKRDVHVYDPRSQTKPQPKKSHAQIKREVDEILARKHSGTTSKSLDQPIRDFARQVILWKEQRAYASPLDAIKRAYNTAIGDDGSPVDRRDLEFARAVAAMGFNAAADIYAEELARA